MNTQDINNHVGDMDLYLLDAILKGHLMGVENVLDLGCGEGRNGVYFIRGGYNYLGVDKDADTLKLVEYLANSIPSSKVNFLATNIQNFNIDKKFDFIICSRALHFANDTDDFLSMWASIVNHLSPTGLVYITMDSIVDNTLATPLSNGLYEFPDGKIRFCLTKELYREMKKGFEEIEPLRTVVQTETRAQSFLLFRKD